MKSLSSTFFFPSLFQKACVRCRKQCASRSCIRSLFFCQKKVCGCSINDISKTTACKSRNSCTVHGRKKKMSSSVYDAQWAECGVRHIHARDLSPCSLCFPHLKTGIRDVSYLRIQFLFCSRFFSKKKLHSKNMSVYNAQWTVCDARPIPSSRFSFFPFSFSKQKKTGVRCGTQYGSYSFMQIFFLKKKQVYDALLAGGLKTVHP